MSWAIGDARAVAGPTGFRWRLTGPSGPPMILALATAEAVRALVFRQAERRGLMPLPDSFHGGTRAAHTHAHWLIEDTDGDGLADHVLLYAAATLPRELLPVLAEGGELAVRLASGARLPAPTGCWRLAPVWMGRGGPTYLFGTANRWRTMTPFVTPLWTRRHGGARAGRDVASQIGLELARRGLPQPATLTIEPGRVVAADWIVQAGLARAGGRRCPPADAEAAHITMCFDAPVAGPLALGFGAHFGLGLFGVTNSVSDMVAFHA